MKVTLALVALPAIALAQSTTTGAVQGVAKDDKTGDPLAGVTVVVTAPTLAGAQTAITDERGFYKISDLPPGSYTVTFYYEDLTVERAATVGVNKTTPVFIKIPHAADGQVIQIQPEAPRREFVERAAPAPVHAARAQLQADLGLAVIGLAYEQPLGDHYALQLEAQAFSTYFAPWFSAGDRVDGFGGQLRPTWFRDVGHHGLYVAPYVRVDRVTHDMAAGVGFAAGAFAGYALPVGPLDVRVGAGAQYMRYFAGPFGVSTPFVALDLVVGYRL